MISEFFRNSPFRSLWIGQFFSQLGLALYIVGTVTFLYTKNQSILEATLFPVVRFSTIWLSGMVAPLVMQRIPLRQLIIRAPFLQALFLLGFVFYLTQYEFYIPVILLFLIAISFMEGWGSASQKAMVPRIIKEEQLVRANSFLSTSSKTVLCLGFFAGGPIFKTLGPIPSLWISLAFVFVGGLSFFFIRDSSDQHAEEKQSNWKVLKETWSFAFKHPVYKRLFLLDCIGYISGSAWVGAIMLVFVKETLDKGADWWTYTHGSYLLGAVIGGLIVLRIDRQIKEKLKLTFIICSASLGILTLLLASLHEPLLTIAFAMIIGIPCQMRDIAFETLLQINADKQLLPRIYAAHTAIVNLSIVVGVVTMAMITKYYGAQIALLLSGALVLISAILARSLPKSK